MREFAADQPRKFSAEEFARKRNAISTIKQYMVKYYPNAKTKLAKKKILAHVSSIFISEFGSQKDEIRQKIISRLFNNKQEIITIDINGAKAEFAILRYAQLQTINGIPAEQLTKQDLPEFFREGVMAELFKREVDRRLQVKIKPELPAIDITPQKKRTLPARLTDLFANKWFQKKYRFC